MLSLHMGVNHWGVATPRFWNGGHGGVVGSLWNIIISYSVQEYIRWKHFPKWCLFRNRQICVYQIKIPGMIPSILCYVCWNFKTHEPQFLNPDPRPPAFKPDWRRWLWSGHSCQDLKGQDIQAVAILVKIWKGMIYKQSSTVESNYVESSNHDKGAATSYWFLLVRPKVVIVVVLCY